MAEGGHVCPRIVHGSAGLQGVDATAAAAKAAEGETMDETESPNDDIKAAEGIVGDDYEGYQLTGDDFMGLPGVNTTAGRVGNFVGCPDCG